MEKRRKKKENRQKKKLKCDIKTHGTHSVELLSVQIPRHLTSLKVGSDLLYQKHWSWAVRMEQTKQAVIQSCADL